MADVQVPTRVREHREREVLGLRRVLVGSVQPALGPPLLPVVLQAHGIIDLLFGCLAHSRLLQVRILDGFRLEKARGIL